MGQLSLEQKITIKNWHWRLTEMIATERATFLQLHPDMELDCRFIVDASIGDDVFHSSTETTRKEVRHG